MNILHGDCLAHLPTLDSSSIQLIYLDPPFFTQKVHTLRTRDHSTEYRFEDCWTSLEEYLSFMRKVLIHCQRLLKETGCLFLHCDKTASHYLRKLLDETFGSQQFQSEIIWAYKRWSNAKKGLLNAHQTIYFYSKTTEFKFNTLYTDYSPTTNVDQILQVRKRSELGKAVYQRDAQGEMILGREKRGVPLSDVWDIPFLNPKAKERVGYPTQKPILLLERIIKIATDKGDKVLDPFCGSGSTLVAAKLLERDYLGIDISLEAIDLCNKRLEKLIRTDSLKLMLGEAHYLEKSETDRIILRAFDAVPVERNLGIDGFLKYHLKDSPVPVRIQKAEEDLGTAKQKLISASQAKKCSVMILVRTHQENGQLFESSVEEKNVIVIDSYPLMIETWLKNDKQNSLD